jgi:hypothetical protein
MDVIQVLIGEKATNPDLGEEETQVLRLMQREYLKLATLSIELEKRVQDVTNREQALAAAAIPVNSCSHSP